MASEQINVVAIVTPADGKKERVQELLSALADDVRKNEPETLRYHLHWNEKDGEFVFLETYANQAAADHHRAQPQFQSTIKTAGEEQLLAKPLDVRHITPIGGFASK